jgi:flagellar biogenesis protein FliO
VSPGDERDPPQDYEEFFSFEDRNPVTTARRTLYVVRAGDKVLLVGSGEHGLTTLSELDPATVAPPPDAEAPR